MTAWTQNWQMPAAGTWIDFRTYPELLGRALVQHLALSFQDTLDYDTLADLLAQRSDVLDVSDDAAPVLAKVGPGQGAIYAWSRYATSGERPDDVSAGNPGRWVRQVLPHVARCGTSRYYQHIGWCDANTPPFGKGRDVTPLWVRCNGQTPALFICYVGDRVDEASQTQAFHRAEADFRIKVLNANWRGGVEAEMTPGRTEDQAESPGSLRLIGDIRDYLIKDNRLLGADPQALLRGRNASLGMLGTAVLRTKIGSHRPAVRRGPNRVVCDELDITCIVSVWTPNTPCEVVSPWKIWMQMQDALGNDVGEEQQMEVPIEENAA